MAPTNLLDQLKRDEGLRLKAYVDTVGKVTIGYGHNLTDRGISEEEAHSMLVDDALDVQRELSKALPWTDTLDYPRTAVLQNMAFNLGVAGLQKFSNFLTRLHDQQWQLAAEAMLNSVWAKQVGDRAQRLAQQIITGEWQ
jgi:lysozyme